jgi:hypothetical protein
MATPFFRPDATKSNWFWRSDFAGSQNLLVINALFELCFPIANLSILRL